MVRDAEEASQTSQAAVGMEAALIELRARADKAEAEAEKRGLELKQAHDGMREERRIECVATGGCFALVLGPRAKGADTLADTLADNDLDLFCSPSGPSQRGSSS